MKKKTRTILGHEITLETGKTYQAYRPILGTNSAGIGPENQTCTVSISHNGNIVHRIEKMSLGEADEFLAAFNNRNFSYLGRNWEEEDFCFATSKMNQWYDAYTFQKLVGMTERELHQEMKAQRSGVPFYFHEVACTIEKNEALEQYRLVKW